MCVVSRRPHLTVVPTTENSRKNRTASSCCMLLVLCTPPKQSNFWQVTRPSLALVGGYTMCKANTTYSLKRKYIWQIGGISYKLTLVYPPYALLLNSKMCSSKYRRQNVQATFLQKRRSAWKNKPQRKVYKLYSR